MVTLVERNGCLFTKWRTIFSLFLNHVTAVLQNGIQNFILSPTVHTHSHTDHLNTHTHTYMTTTIFFHTTYNLGGGFIPFHSTHLHTMTTPSSNITPPTYALQPQLSTLKGLGADT